MTQAQYDQTTRRLESQHEELLRKIDELDRKVAEVLADAGVGVPFRRLGLPDVYVTQVGSQGWLCDQYGIGPDGIADSVRALVRRT